MSPSVALEEVAYRLHCRSPSVHLIRAVKGIQAELEDVHPGPNRGVKQGPFAVITNVIMPAVLVEVGFISNREEERALSRGEFQREVAVALAQGVRGFFERYPPGQGVAVQGSLR